VHGANDRDVVARAVASVTAVVALEVARLGGFGWRRTVPAKGIVALECVGADVMDMHVASSEDILARKADYLAILVDCLAFLHVAKGDFVPHPDRAVAREGAAVWL